jgi:hypothetical protein
VDWDTTAKTAAFTAVSGNGYFVNTTSGAITVTLPASPSAGDIVAVSDYANTFATNALTVARNGSLINGEGFDYENSTNGISLTFVYVDGTRGWKNVNDGTTNATGISPYIVACGGTIVTCGNYKTHIFTSPGTFTVSKLASCSADDTMDYFVIGGGGGGGEVISGGGGAGGFRISNDLCAPACTTSPLANATGITATVTSYPITVAGGGSALSNGSNSVFSTITSAGGGTSNTGTFSDTDGQPGASGGGGSWRDSPGTSGGGAGNTPPVSPPQGNPGGGSTGNNTSAGGGGAGATGTSSPCNSVSGTGGIGSYISDIVFGPTAPSYGETGPVGSSRYFAGGGGGSGRGPAGIPGAAGGIGGGGNGATYPGTAECGVANTGGGGGGNGPAGGVGGSGIVMIRYRYQ